MLKGKARDGSKEAAWRRRLGRQAKSGQSVRAWCHKHRVTETAFYWWRRELARRDAEPAAARHAKGPGRSKQATSRDTKGPGRGTSSFVPMHVVEEPAQDSDQLHAVQDSDPQHAVQRGDGGQMEIVLTDGRRVCIAGPVNRERLTVVMDVLERRTC